MAAQVALMATDAAALSGWGLSKAMTAADAAENATFGMFGFVVRPSKNADSTLREFYLKIVDSPEFARDTARYNSVARFTSRVLGLKEAATVDEIREALLNETTFARVKSNFAAAVFQGDQHAFETRFLLQGRESTILSLPTTPVRAARHELVHMGAALRGQREWLGHEAIVSFVTTPEVPIGGILVTAGGVYIVRQISAAK